MSNNIKYIANDSKLMKEWNWAKNNKLGFNPNQLKWKSNKKVWWECKYGHEWVASISHRIEGKGCPYCSGNKVIIGETDLCTTHPEIAIEWHPTKNNNLKPTDFSAGSDKKIWWICKNGHEWRASIGSRCRGTGCPYCSGNKIIQGFNDLETVRPDLIKEWNYKKNGSLMPSQVFPNSNKKVWWICEQGHEWMSTPNNRNAGKGCPVCAKEMQTSFPEQAILFYCNKITVAENRNNDFGKEIDIYLPKYKVGIEYNGIYYHKNRREQDQEKINYFKDKGIRIISVNESNKNYITEDVIEYDYTKINNGSLDWVIKSIFEIINIEYKTVDINVCLDSISIWDQYLISKKENSLLKKYPQIALEWHPTKNGKIKPENVHFGSNKKFWWLCSKCTHEWKTSVSHRTFNGSGCPMCATKNRNANNRKSVYCIELDKIFCSLTEAEKQTGVYASNIRKQLNGKINHTGKHPITGANLHWEWVNN